MIVDDGDTAGDHRVNERVERRGCDFFPLCEDGLTQVVECVQLAQVRVDSAREDRPEGLHRVQVRTLRRPDQDGDDFAMNHTEVWCAVWAEELPNWNQHPLMWSRRRMVTACRPAVRCNSLR